MATAIEFENISKQYRLGLVSTRTLSHDLNRWWTVSVRGKEDPYLRIGETNDRSVKGSSDYVWALKDIDFKVEQGDVVGIIGRNGAGKSTLLKLLSRVTAPTTGQIRARGRIGSLLEVGTGFHPEMTGRENIYMNGAILGMTRAEVSRKLDEIVDFSGCERYLDTPVKRYSSGMMVRLGFAVAAHLDPEILVVDEVLAVGDAEFQKKAIGKMKDVSQGEGRTVLFVSHNMVAVKNLCTRGVLLDKGTVCFDGSVDDAVSEYINGNKRIGVVSIIHNVSYLNPSVILKSIEINGSQEAFQRIPSEQDFFTVRVEGFSEIEFRTDFLVMFYSMDDTPLATYGDGLYTGYLEHIEAGRFVIERMIRLPRYVNSGTVKVGMFFMLPDVCFYMKAENAAILEFEGRKNTYGRTLPMNSSGFLGLESK